MKITAEIINKFRHMISEEGFDLDHALVSDVEISNLLSIDSVGGIIELISRRSEAKKLKEKEEKLADAKKLMCEKFGMDEKQLEAFLYLVDELKGTK